MATLTLSSMMRRYAALILIVGSLFAVSCKDDEDSDGRFTASDSFAYRAVEHSLIIFNLSAINGSVEVVGDAESDSVIILAERIVRGNNQHNADVGLQNLQVEVGGNGGIYFVRTIQPNDNDGNDYEVQYHISLPQRARIEVSQGNGDISISSFSDEPMPSYTVEAETVNGNITLTDIQGSAIAALTNGSLTCATQYAELDTFDLIVVNGTINLQIPTEVSATFFAQVNVGTVSVNGLNLSDAVVTPTSVTGTLGTGEGRITLRGTTGTITVSGN